MGARELVTLADIRSVALTLGAKRVAEQALVQSLAHPVTPVQVTDTEAVDAVEAFVDDHRVLVEPSCGAALSLVYNAHEALVGPVLAIVCGGAAATRESLAAWRAGVRD